MTTEDTASQERRESFRIDDTVKLKIRLLDEESYKLMAEDFTAFRLRYCMKSHFLHQKEVLKPKLIRIRKTDPEIASYLESLEVQIAELAQRMDQNSVQSADTQDFTVVANLSATGVQFVTNISIEVSQTIEIGMVLSTSNTQVMMLGEVMRLEDTADKRKMVSIRYTHIHSEDTEAIMLHLARLQQIELQSRRA